MHAEYSAWTLHQQQAAQSAIEIERMRRINERNRTDPAPANAPWWAAFRDWFSHWTLPRPRPAIPLH
ncbi:MAG TPA: hypothetical protein PKV13_05785 [Propionicimonas sp.]|nr:hypothetical protein [Propionicimonas sp.]HRA06114.1 hypothetical protein [Propionicimonas sp.]